MVTLHRYAQNSVRQDCKLNQDDLSNILLSDVENFIKISRPILLCETSNKDDMKTTKY